MKVVIFIRDGRITTVLSEEDIETVEVHTETDPPTIYRPDAYTTPETVQMAWTDYVEGKV